MHLTKKNSQKRQNYYRHNKRSQKRSMGGGGLFRTYTEEERKFKVIKGIIKQSKMKLIKKKVLGINKSIVPVYEEELEALVGLELLKQLFKGRNFIAINKYRLNNIFFDNIEIKIPKGIDIADLIIFIDKLKINNKNDKFTFTLKDQEEIEITQEKFAKDNISEIIKRLTELLKQHYSTNRELNTELNEKLDKLFSFIRMPANEREMKVFIGTQPVDIEAQVDIYILATLFKKYIKFSMLDLIGLIDVEPTDIRFKKITKQIKDEDNKKNALNLLKTFLEETNKGKFLVNSTNTPPGQTDAIETFLTSIGYAKLFYPNEYSRIRRVLEDLITPNTGNVDHVNERVLANKASSLSLGPIIAGPTFSTESPYGGTFTTENYSVVAKGKKLSPLKRQRARRYVKARAPAQANPLPIIAQEKIREPLGNVIERVRAAERAEEAAAEARAAARAEEEEAPPRPPKSREAKIATKKEAARKEAARKEAAAEAKAAEEAAAEARAATEAEAAAEEAVIQAQRNDKLIKKLKAKATKNTEFDKNILKINKLQLPLDKKTRKPIENYVKYKPFRSKKTRKKLLKEILNNLPEAENSSAAGGARTNKKKSNKRSSKKSKKNYTINKKRTHKRK